MKKVFVQGLGFVGSAVATAISISKDNQGRPLYSVYGVDLPTKIGLERVIALNNGEFPFPTSDESLIKAVSESHLYGNLVATTNQNKFGEADIVIVDLPLDITYLDNEPQLEFSDFTSAIRVLGQQVQQNTLIIVETTVPPGTCEKIVLPTLKNEFKKRGLNPEAVLLAHSYERVMPGDNYLSSITDYWRVYSGHTKEAADVCEHFLNTIINIDEYPLTRLSTTTASETAKVLENTYRAANIAFIDEWTKFAETIGIDLFEVLDAIRKRPTHSNIRFPGLGVGGYCLTKDPTLTPAAASQLFNKKLDFPFSNMTVKINHNMPLHTVNRITSLLGGSLKGKHLLICGISYRQDIGDTRFSPTEMLVRELLLKGVKITCHDPYVTFWDELDIKLEKKLPSPKDFNAVIMTVPHKEYKKIDLSKWIKTGNIILDANSVLNKQQIRTARDCGAVVESIGKANGL
tara:strand:+ start:17406 stop:18785 length:1380 start_codon:yes stop_codon:yes gene_type:complete